MIKDHLLLGVLWVLFCFFHSALAAGKLKGWISARSPWIDRYYRLLYTLFATFSFFGVVLYQVQLPSPKLLPQAFRWIGYPILLAGVALMLVCIQKYFLSLSGLKSLATLQPNTHSLKVEGVHRYVRHPLYLGTFIAIWGLFLILPTASILLSNSIIQVYTLIGIGFEEKKLVKVFGDQYIEYRKRVPPLIPAWPGKWRR